MLQLLLASPRTVRDTSIQDVCVVAGTVCGNTACKVAWGMYSFQKKKRNELLRRNARALIALSKAPIGAIIMQAFLFGYKL